MKGRARILGMGACVVALLCGAAGMPRAGGLAGGPSPADDNNAFALDLYGALSTGEGNLFLSPYSISTALAAAYAGAGGNTAAQMSTVLHFGPRGEKFDLGFKALIGAVARSGGSKGYELHSANAMWVQQGYGLLKAFQETIEKNYGAGVYETDFRSAGRGSSRAINDWVARETRGKISQVVSPGVIDGATRLVLANAVYFKGDWDSKFERSDTEDGTFHLAADSQVEVAMMHQENDFEYMKTGAAEVLELPYVGDGMSMIVVLPTAADGLAEVEKTLTMDALKRWLSQLSTHSVEVALPKFEMERALSLREVLSAMGMPDAFVSSVADFSGINGRRDLFVQEVAHKAWIDVYEEGTKAAAATSISIGCGGGPSFPPAVFRADHPFLFMIVEKESGSILFLGRVRDPRG